MRYGLILAVAVSAVSLAAASPASATLYDWTLTGVDSGSGTLTTGAAADGGFDITMFNGMIDGNSIVGLLGGNPGIPTTSPSGYFTYDNILYPGSTPVLDYSGVLFSILGTEGNLFGNGIPNNDSYWVCCYSVVNDKVDTFTVAAVPEPGTLALLGAGLVGLALIRRRRRAPITA